MMSTRMFKRACLMLGALAVVSLFVALRCAVTSQPDAIGESPSRNSHALQVVRAGVARAADMPALPSGPPPPPGLPRLELPSWSQPFDPPVALVPAPPPTLSAEDRARGR